MEKYTLWILVGLIAYVLFKDKLFGGGAISGSFAAGTRSPAYGPSPTGNTYANTPPGMVSPGPTPPPGKNVWDAVTAGITTAGAAFDTYEINN